MRTLLALVLLTTVAHPADIRTHPQYKEWVLALSDGPDEERLEALWSLNRLDLDTSPLFPVMRQTLKETESSDVAIAIAKHASGARINAKEFLPDLLKAVRRGVLPSARVILLAAKHDDPMLVELLRGCLRSRQQDFKATGGADQQPLRDLLWHYPKCGLRAVVEGLAEGSDADRQFLFHFLHNTAVQSGATLGLEGVVIDRMKVWQEPSLADALEKQLRPFLANPDPQTRIRAMELMWHAKPALADELFAYYFGALLGGDTRAEMALSYDAFLRAFPKLVERLLGTHEVADCAHDYIHTLCRDTYRKDQSRASVLPVIRAQLRHPHPTVRRTLVRVLMHNMPDNEDAIREFTRCLDDADRGVRLAACEGLLQKPKDHTSAVVRVLREALHAGTVGHKAEALELLTQLGPAGRVLVPDMLRLAKHPAARIRAGVGFALFKVDPTMRATYLPLFADTLTTGTLKMQKQVLLALPDIGPPAKLLVPVLQKMLRENLHDYDFANPIANAIIWVAPEHAQATRELLYSKRNDP